MVSAQVTVRLAKLDDARAIAELCGELGYPCAPEQAQFRLEEILAREDHAVLVAERGGAEVIGWVHVFLSVLLERELQSEIGGLVTSEDHRGVGAGRLLMRAAEAWTQQRGGEAVCVRSNVVREGAHAFYRHLGYETVKTSFTFRKYLELGETID